MRFSVDASSLKRYATGAHIDNADNDTYIREVWWPLPYVALLFVSNLGNVFVNYIVPTIVGRDNPLVEIILHT